MFKSIPRFWAAGLCFSVFFSFYGCDLVTREDKPGPVDLESSLGETQDEVAGTFVTQNGEILLEKAFTGYGRGSIECPAEMVAIAGGAYCTNNGLDVTAPEVGVIDGQALPIGWTEWHRGSSSNDCVLYAVCTPATWFGQGELTVVTNTTFYGQGSVACPPNFRALGGGSHCTDGDFDVARPNPALTGYDEWHRGASSNDCSVSAVCVSNSNWISHSIYFTHTLTGYGDGDGFCGAGDIAVGGGSYCTDGDADWDYPRSDLSGWSEHHRGPSSGDCEIDGVCLRGAAVHRVAPGMGCNGTTGVYDCDDKCVDKATALSWKTDTFCDDGRYGMNLVCSQFDFDNHTCG